MINTLISPSLVILIKVKPNARENKIERIDCSVIDKNKRSFSGGCFAVSVKSPPKEGKANEEAIRLIADYFKISPSRIRIISGAAAKNKILEIN
jgi:uncharacterized protein YggU (UPF0235/DUF167 family)